MTDVTYRLLEAARDVYACLLYSSYNRRKFENNFVGLRQFQESDRTPSLPHAASDFVLGTFRFAYVQPAITKRDEAKRYRRL